MKILRSLFPLVAVAVAVAVPVAVPAQIQTVVTAGTDVVASAGVSQTLPKNTIVTGVAKLSAADPYSSSHMDATFDHTQPNAFSIRVRGVGGYGYQSPGSPAILSDTPGATALTPAKLLWTFRGHGKGTLSVNASVSHIIWLFNDGRVEIDIDDDGTVEHIVTASTPVTLQIPLTVAVERKVAFRVYAAASYLNITGNAVTTVSVDATFLQTNTPANFNQYGSRCGAAMTGYDVPTLAYHDLRWDVTGAFPNQPVALVLGTMRTSTPIMGCTLYTSPIVGIGLVADFTGYATWNARVPKPVVGMIQSQAFPLDTAAGRLTASAGLEIAFAD